MKRPKENKRLKALVDHSRQVELEARVLVELRGGVPVEVEELARRVGYKHPKEATEFAQLLLWMQTKREIKVGLLRVDGEPGFYASRAREAGKIGARSAGSQF